MAAHTRQQPSAKVSTPAPSRQWPRARWGGGKISCTYLSPHAHGRRGGYGDAVRSGCRRRQQRYCKGANTVLTPDRADDLRPRGSRPIQEFLYRCAIPRTRPRSFRKTPHERPVTAPSRPPVQGVSKVWSCCTWTPHCSARAEKIPHGENIQMPALHRACTGNRIPLCSGYVLAKSTNKSTVKKNCVPCR
jgi:hypothetical protein